MKTDADIRRSILAKIHIAKAQLGMDTDAYRALLQRIAGVDSAADLLPDQAERVLAEMRRLGWRDKGARYGNLRKRYARPGNERLMASIRKMLADANRPWSYADTIAKKMCGIDRLEWCSYENLKNVHTSLKKDERRRKGKTL